MIQFEVSFNGTDNLKGKRTICTVINNLKTGETFTADLVAKNFSDLDSRMPKGYEVDRLTTLCNYFNPVKIDKYRIELKNSQFVYFADFHKDLLSRMHDYLQALENDKMSIVSTMDYIYRVK